MTSQHDGSTGWDTQLACSFRIQLAGKCACGNGEGQARSVEFCSAENVIGPAMPANVESQEARRQRVVHVRRKTHLLQKIADQSKE